MTPPVITHTPPAPGSLPKGKAVTITAKFTDESKFYPQIFFRYGPGPYEKPIDMKKSKTGKDMYEVTIPYKTDTVDYYLEAYDDFGNGPARAGDPDKPFALKLGEEAPPPPPAVTQSTNKPSTGSGTTARPSGGSCPSCSSGGGGRIWTWVAGGVGLGMLTGGLLAGLAVKSEDDALKTQIAGTTGPGGQTTVSNTQAIAQHSDANKSLGTKATILTIGGAVLLAGGVALYFVEGGSDDAGPAPSKSGGSKPAKGNDKKKDADYDGPGFTGSNDLPPPPAPTASITGFGVGPIEGGAMLGLSGRF
ncbi:MAG: hypothetical protein JST92_14025 [Deltaproteobacteria bacterium]|nr:hypothetical protein [Deltaproteobacteria bacterium]